MEAAQIVALPVSPRVRPSVHVEGETVVVDRLRVTDRSLAAFVEQRTEDERGELAERALRIGLLAIQDAGTTLDVEFVRREFDGLLARNETMNDEWGGSSAPGAGRRLRLCRRGPLDPIGNSWQVDGPDPRVPGADGPGMPPADSLGERGPAGDLGHGRGRHRIQDD